MIQQSKQCKQCVTSDITIKGTLLLQGNDGTFNFLETVLKEVLELFPSEHVHIGGDEVRLPAAAALQICSTPTVMSASGMLHRCSPQRISPYWRRSSPCK